MTPPHVANERITNNASAIVALGPSLVTVLLKLDANGETKARHGSLTSHRASPLAKPMILTAMLVDSQGGHLLRRPRRGSASRIVKEASPLLWSARSLAPSIHRGRSDATQLRLMEVTRPQLGGMRGVHIAVG